jgi:hypothetical protein
VLPQAENFSCNSHLFTSDQARHIILLAAFTCTKGQAAPRRQRGAELFC